MAIAWGAVPGVALAAVGDLTPLSPATIDTGLGSQSAVVSPDGKQVYVLDVGPLLSVGNYSTVTSFTRDPDSGALSPLATTALPAGSVATAMQMSPDGTSLYVVGYMPDPDNSSNMLFPVWVLTRDAETGALSPTTPASFEVGGYPIAVAVAPDGKQVYFGRAMAADVAMVPRDPETGVLDVDNMDTVSTGAFWVGLASSPDGKSVYATDSTGELLHSYQRDPETGKLSGHAQVSMTSPDAAMVSPDGKQVYVTSFGSNTLSVFTRDLSNGALSPQAEQTLTTEDRPYGMVMSPDGLSVYVSSTGLGGMV
ncbi:MAG: beta-propeller fold lactonase family protein, partial [Patulibacter sp.]